MGLQLQEPLSAYISPRLCIGISSFFIPSTSHQLSPFHHFRTHILHTDLNYEGYKHPRFYPGGHRIPRA